jgi:ppGpp synthetase/RelA/SpoT-type nucleotidyltranferase
MMFCIALLLLPVHAPACSWLQADDIISLSAHIQLTELLIPDFFELQIKTLYQHAWSQAEHGLGYKPETPLSNEEQRKLAFIAAQSWGADTILAELVDSKK